MFVVLGDVLNSPIYLFIHVKHIMASPALIVQQPVPAVCLGVKAKLHPGTATGLSWGHVENKHPFALTQVSLISQMAKTVGGSQTSRVREITEAPHRKGPRTGNSSCEETVTKVFLFVLTH